jgi:hypothetical protein
MNLARMEMLALFTAPATRVRRFEIVEAEPVLHNILRGFRTLRVTVSCPPSGFRREGGTAAGWHRRRRNVVMPPR